MSPSPSDAKQAVLKHFAWEYDHANMWPLFTDATAFGTIVSGLAAPFRDAGITTIAGVESRGFLLGGAVAQHLGVGFTAIRKHGSLFPGHKLAKRTERDYRGNTHVLLIQNNSIGASDRVLLVDDWLETGSQASTAAWLIAQTGAALVSTAVIVDQLSEDNAAAASQLGAIHSLVRYSELPTPACCAYEEAP